MCETQSIAVLLLILVFGNCAGILFSIGMEFLAFCFLIVYVGAIAVLFLFVVMVLNIKLVDLTSSEFNYLPLNTFIVAALGVEIVALTYSTFQPSSSFTAMTYVRYIKYLDSFSTQNLLDKHYSYSTLSLL
jgi:NADH:ubiquinone oxidoreductase subunit 6 (subunit J)